MKLLNVIEMFLDTLRRLKQQTLHYVFMNYPKLLSDKTYLTIFYKYTLGSNINWKHPILFTEKLQYLKLYDRKPFYSRLVDKYEVKSWVSDKIGSQHIIPTLGIWEHFDDIDFSSLPNQFVLKCTHDSGSVLVCLDKSKFDIARQRDKFEKALAKNFYWNFREWPYKNVHPRIIAEKYLCDEFSSNKILLDYKFFCFNGVPKFMYISNDKGEFPVTDFFDMDFNHLEFRFRDPNSNIKINKPEKFDQMVKFATILSQNIPFVRVDFYQIKNNVYFGEMTFYHNAGFFPITPSIYNKVIGDFISTI